MVFDYGITNTLRQIKKIVHTHLNMNPADLGEFHSPGLMILCPMLPIGSQNKIGLDKKLNIV